MGNKKKHNVRKIRSKEKLEILIETNLNDKLKEALAKRLGEGLALLSDIPCLPNKDLTNNSV